MKRLSSKVIGGAVLVSSFFCTSSLSAQPSRLLEEAVAGRDSVRVIPGEHYRAGALHRLFFGSHWRSLWTSPMEVEVLDLETFAGGLVPYKTGGGYQTISLRFKGADGKRYRFRSIDKDPSRGMPEKLHNTLVSRVVQDQVSSANPVGLKMIELMQDAAGILAPSARFVVMPYDAEGLGKFYEEFAGLLGTIEEHPDENDGGDTAFAGADLVTNTYTMFATLDASNAFKPEAKCYLKARLFDIFIGDWDRHSGQWRWAGYRNGEGGTWKPVAKDRDNAFSRQDGVFSWVITQIIPQIEGFREEYPSVKYISWSGRAVDRRIFPLLSRQEWMAVATDLQHVLDDNLLRNAIAAMPPEMKAKEGDRLLRELQVRRDNLQEIASDLYEFYAREVEIHGSDRNEFALLERFADGSVNVAVYELDSTSGVPKGKPFYTRRFSLQETREIRLDMHGGQDIVRIEGPRSGDMDLHVVGGKGADSLQDLTVASSHAFSGKHYFYDDDPDTEFLAGKRTRIDRSVVDEPDELADHYDTKRRDAGSEFVASIANTELDYAPEYGIFLGWGVKYEDYGFRKDPYNYHAALSGGVATGAGEPRYKLALESDFRSVVPGAELHVDVGTTGLEVINFYGFGNETDRNDRDEDDFEIRQQVTWLRPTLFYPANSDKQFWTGVEAKFINLEVDPGSFLETNNPVGIEEEYVGSLRAGFRYDTRDCGSSVLLSPRKIPGRLADTGGRCGTAALKGMLVDLEASWSPEFLGNTDSFGRIRGEWRGYQPLFSLPYSRVALRAGGEKLWGDYPFYEAAFLGGSTSLRGYDRERFAGDASLYAGSEVRLYLGEFKFLVPVMFGPLAFVETGRVYFEDDPGDSGQWHTGYGGGLWFSFIESRYALTIAVGRGTDSARLSDDYGLYIRTGFSF